MTMLESCDGDDLFHLCATTLLWAHRAMGRAAARSRKRFLDGAKTAWKEFPGKLHRAVNEPSPPKLEVVSRCTSKAPPALVMGTAATTWSDIWSAPDYDEGELYQA